MNMPLNMVCIPRIKNILRSVESTYVKKIVNKAMFLKTSLEVEEFILEQILKKYPRAFLMGQIEK